MINPFLSLSREAVLQQLKDALNAARARAALWAGDYASDMAVGSGATTHGMAHFWIDPARLSRLFYDGHHWLDGFGWIGPIPATSDKTYQSVKSEIARVFCSKNVVKEVVDRQIDGVLGREPMFSYALRRAVSEDEPATPEEVALLAESNDALTSWWDRRGMTKLLREVATRAKLGTQVCVRFYVPRGILDAKGEVPPGTLEESLDRIYVQVTEPGQAGELVDPETQLKAALYNEQGKYVEMVFVEGEETVIRVWRDVAASAVIYVPPGGAPQAFDYSLAIGRRRTIREFKSEPLVTQQVRENQMAINLAKTMENRNVVTGGFLERIVLDAMPPGRWIPDPDKPGQEMYEVGPFKVGSGTTNFFLAAEYRDQEGNKHFGNPSVHFRDPVAPDTFIATKRNCYQDILEETEQSHVLISGDATASGESRKQALAGFRKRCQGFKADLDPLGRWLMETPLAMAAVFANRAGTFDALRGAFECVIDVGPRSATEQKEDRDSVAAGLLSKETALVRDGSEDPAAELGRIAGEEEASLTNREAKATIVQTLAAGGAGIGGAATVAGFDADEVAALTEGDFVAPPAA